MKNCRKFSHLAPALLVCFAATPLLAATHVWTGEVSNRFSEGANWRGGSPAGDPLAELVFPEAVRQSIVNDLAALTVQSMKFETDGYELRGNTIDVAEGTELELRENTLACALRFEGKIVEAPLRGHATFARTSRQAVAASSEPATNAQSTVFQFTPTTVAARVTRSAETVWLAIVRHSNFYQRLAARRGDTDGDGIVEWDLPVSEVGLTNSKWCVIDLAARKVHAANRDGSEVEVQPMSVRFLRDASGAYSVADVNWGTDPLNTSDLLWVRPGVGAWRRSSTLLGQATINGQLRRLEALSRFAPLEGSPEAPAGVQRGDFLVAMTMGNFGEGVVFGGLVDAALGATSTNPAELFWFSGGTQEGRPTLSLLRFGSAERAITLSYSVTAGTAVAGVHFQPTAGNVTIEPGEILSSFPLAIIDDDVYSGRQTVRVELSNVSGATVFPATSATTGIADNDPAPVVSAGNTSVAEGGDGPHTVPVKLTLTGKTRVPAEVSWRAYFENATPPQMFETVVFAPGETEKTILVPFTGNTTPGTDRMLVLELDRAVDATIATRLIQIIVQDDDGTGISADEAEVTEAAGAMAKVRVRLDAPSAQPVSVNFRADGQGYASASDYEPASGTLTFAPGETEKFVTVTIRQDAIPEADEVIRLTLSNPVPSTMAIHGSGRITVHDDGDKVSAITFDGDTEAAEGDPAVFGLMSTPRVEKDVRLGVRLVPGTAKPREDYASDFDRYETTAGVRFGATGSSSTFSSAFLVLYTFADSEVEPDETVSVELFNFDDPSHVLGSRTLVIKDTTHLDPVLRVSNTTVVEGSTATFQVSIAQSAAYPISFYVTTVGDTADEGADFTRVANVYNIPKGERRVTVDVKTIGDGLAEGDETFSIRLSQPYNARIDDAIGRATIVDDDTPMPAFTAANVAVRESETTARFVVELATPATQRVTLTYATANGTATSGDDYVAAGGTLVFEAGETTKTIDVTLINDTLTESAETFSLRIGAAAEAVCTITDDDGKSTRKRSVRH